LTDLPSQPRRRKHRRLRKGQRAKRRQVDRVGVRCFGKAKRRLIKRGLIQDAAVQVQPNAFSDGRCSLQDEQQHSSTDSIGRQTEAEATRVLSYELTTVMKENQQLQEELTYAKEQLELLQLQIDCNFTTAQMQQATAVCGVKRVTQEALSSGACKYVDQPSTSDSDSSDSDNSSSTFPKKEGAATPQNQTHASNTRTSSAVTVAAELEDATTKSMAAQELKAKELKAQELAAHRPMSKTQKKKALIKQAAAAREEALKQRKMQKIPWAKRQTETQLLFAFTLTVVFMVLIVVGIVYVAMLTT